jgi:hypothetical protein
MYHGTRAPTEFSEFNKPDWNIAASWFAQSPRVATNYSSAYAQLPETDPHREVTSARIYPVIEQKILLFLPPLRTDSDLRLARSTFTKPDFKIIVRSTNPGSDHRQGSSTISGSQKFSYNSVSILTTLRSTRCSIVFWKSSSPTSPLPIYVPCSGQPSLWPRC